MLPWALEAKDWIKLEAEDFTIMSDARESQVVEFAVEYAAQRFAVRSVFAKPGIQAPRSILILHDRKKDLLDYVSDTERGSRFTRFSWSAVVDGRAVTALSMSSNRKETLDTVTEFETIHALSQLGWSVPIWMSQGAGIVFSTVKVDSKNSQVVIGSESNAERVWSEGVLLDWDRFFEVSQGSEEYSGEKANGRFQGQAWGLVHWLLLRDDAGRERFETIESRIKTEGWERTAEIVESVGGVALKDLRKEIKRHLGRRPPVMRLPFDQEVVRASFELSPLADAERFALMADIAASSGRKAESDGLYFQAKALAPDSIAVLESGARWFIREGDRDRAVENYRRAIELGTKNARAYLFSADWRLDRTGLGRDYEGSGVPVVLDPARAEVKRALELDGSFGEAYALAGRIAYIEPEPDPAHLEILSRRVGPDFWGTRARYYRALLLGRLGRMDEAIKDMVELISDPETSRQTRDNAEKVLSRWRLGDLRDRVLAAMNAGEFEAAKADIAAWEQAEAMAGDRAELDRLKTMVEQGRVKHLQNEYDRNRSRLHADLQAGRIEQAWTRIEKLAAETDDPSLSKGYQAMRRQIQGLVMTHRVTVATKRQKWVEVKEAAQAFLAEQPTDHAERKKMEAALAEADAALAAP